MVWILDPNDPKCIEETVTCAEAVANVGNLQIGTVDSLLPRSGEVAALARGCRQVLFIARGTSDNAAVYGSYLLQARAGLLATLGSPSIATEYHSRLDLSGVLAVALSQSGATEEIVETLAWARECGARTLAVTNGGGSALAEVAELAFVTLGGRSAAVPATKTFTTQLAALAVLAIGLGAGLDAGLLGTVPDEIERCWPAWTAWSRWWPTSPLARGADLPNPPRSLAARRERACGGPPLANRWRGGVRARARLCGRAGAGAQAQGGVLPARDGAVLG